jgi:hypothetical protein
VWVTAQSSKKAWNTAGEVKRPRQDRSVVLYALYTLVQCVAVATVGTTITDRPLAQAASMLMSGGSVILTIAAMISYTGWRERKACRRLH